eukprot:TRINITY_DN6250_c0_g1_i1.p1 TRINITY_DN6250_c0_g1~~TRINITY_DN6250_c0_g1_i1.p1  ORF type:complete len:1362 (-),score=479.40 TRINITY_DN6250_c0_g1_i1:136-4221(-)
MDADPDFVKDIDARAGRGDSGCQAASRCLQAMRGVICQQGMQGSPTAYFAATVMTLQKQVEQPAGLSGEVPGALLLILRRALAAVPPAVVHARLNDVVAVLERLLKAQENEELVRLCIGCLGAAANLAYDAGSRPNRKVLKPVFVALQDPRSTVRRRSQLVATAIIRRAKIASDEQTFEFVCQHLAQIASSSKSGKAIFDELPVQNVVGVLRDTAEEFPTEGLGNICAALVALPGQLGQHPCCTEAFDFLASYLGDDEEDEDDDEEMADSASKTAKLELAAKLLPGLLTVPSNILNVGYVSAYMRALAAATALLLGEEVKAGSPPQATKQKLAAFSKLAGFLAERDPSILKYAGQGCSEILEAAGEGGDMKFMESMADKCRALLRYEMKAAWQYSLPVVGDYFNALAAIRVAKVPPAEISAWTAARFQGAVELIKELVGIRDKAKSAELNVFGKELDQCIAAAITAFGPEHVLTVAKLELLEHSLGDAAYEQKSRSWLLLVLKDSVKQTKLATFCSEFLPLAGNLKARASQVELSSQLAAKKYMTLVEQVWALLPGFCEEPLDAQAAMLADGGRLAKQLVAVLLNEPELREFVWSAFHNLCKAVLEPETEMSEALVETNKGCLRTLSSRVMPEMFTTFVKMHAESEGKDESRTSQSRRIAMEAVKAYSQVAEQTLVGNFFKNIMAKLLKATAGTDESVPLVQAAPLGDLSNALIPYLDGDGLELALKVFSPMLSGTAATDDEEGGAAAIACQKTAYRALGNVLKHPLAQDAKYADASKILGFWHMLRDSRQTCSGPALKARLAAMETLLTLMAERLPANFSQEVVRKSYLDCLSAVLPEIIMHLRDQSTSVRDASRECLRVATTTAITGDLQSEIVTLLSAGLASLSPHSKASAIDAMARLLYEHHGSMAGTLKDRLIKVVLLLLQDVDVQVWRAALKFTKVVVYVEPRERLEGYVPQIVKLFEHPQLATAKMMVRKLVERLAKLLPAHQLSEAFPQAHKPLLNYVQKQLARRQRPKAVREKQAEEEEEEEQQEKKTRKGKKGKIAVPDEADDDDDPEVSKVGKKKKSFDEFQEGDDDMGVAKAQPQAGAGKKRGRAAEPPTSAVMAHEAVQAMLDAWEAESDDEEGGGKKKQGKDKRKRDVVDASTWIHENSDVPLDFMSADAAHSVLTVRPPQAKRRKGEEVGSSGTYNKADALRRSGLTFGDDGRLVVEDMEDGDDEEKKESGFNVGTDGEKKPKALSKLAEIRAKREEAKRAQRIERRKAHQVKGLDSYKPRKKNAQGDSMRKGQQLEPFAYVRLNPKLVKEKFKDKATTSFSKVVRGAKKGVLKGFKAKAMDKKFKQAKEDKKKRKVKRDRKPGAR